MAHGNEQMSPEGTTQEAEERDEKRAEEECPQQKTAPHLSRPVLLPSLPLDLLHAAPWRSFLAPQTGYKDGKAPLKAEQVFLGRAVQPHQRVLRGWEWAPGASCGAMPLAPPSPPPSPTCQLSGRTAIPTRSPRPVLRPREGPCTPWPQRMGLGAGANERP